MRRLLCALLVIAALMVAGHAQAQTSTPTVTPTATPTQTFGPNCAPKSTIDNTIIALNNNTSCLPQPMGPTSGKCYIGSINGTLVLNCPGAPLRSIDTTAWPPPTGSPTPLS